MRMKKRRNEREKKTVSTSLLDLYEFEPGMPPEEYDWRRMLVAYVSTKGRAIRKVYYIASKNLFVAADGSSAGKLVRDVIGWVLDPNEDD